MKNIFKLLSSLSLWAVFAALMAGCEKDANFKMYEYPMPKPTGISPSEGYIQSRVLITGTDFGDQVEAVKVFFGGVEADSVLMCKNNRIVVKVPDAAVTGAVSLEVWGKSVDSVATFTVLPTPTIVSVRSDNGLGEGVAAAGDLVTITGTNFGTDASVISVSFNGTSADFELVDEEHIVATAPAGYASGSVYVTINGMRLTGDAMMNPESKGDVTIFYLENYARPFQQIPYISGQEGDRSMAVPQGWTVNDAAESFVNKNADQSAGKVGGMFTGNGTSLGMQAGWGGSGSASSITNGKMYQSTVIPAGTYSMEISYVECNVANKACIVLMKGNAELPDLEGIASASGIIASAYFTSNSVSNDNPGVETLHFTLDEDTEVTFGFVATFGNNSYFKVSDIKLILE